MNINLTDIAVNDDILADLAAGNSTPWEVKTPFTDWRNAANELARESVEKVDKRALELYNQVDPGRGRAMGGSTKDLAFKEIVQEPAAASWMETYTSQGLPPYKVDPASGEKVYINTPPGVNLIDLLEGKDREEYLAMKKAGFDERLTKTPYNVETGLYGSGAGNYGTRVIPEKLNNFQKALSSPIVSALAAFIPGGSLALVAGKTLAGVDVSPVEIALAAHGAYGDYAKSIANKAIKETGGQAVGPTIDVELTTAEQQAAAIDVIDIAGDPSAFEGVDIAGLTPETVSVIDIAGDPSAFAGVDIAALTPEVTQSITDIRYRALDDVVERLGGGTEGTAALNRMTNEQLARNLRAAGDIEGLNALGLAEVGERTTAFYPLNPRLRSDLVREFVSYVGPSFSPDTFMEITEDTIPFDRPSSRVTVDVSNLEDTPVTQPQPTRESFLPSDQPSGGGGGGGGGTGLAGGATTTTSGSVSVTPNIDYTAPGSVTSSFFSDFINPAAAVAGADTSTSPLTPITTTAPDQESYTTTRPTSVLDNTTDDTTTAPDTTGGGSTGGVEDPVSTGGAEGGGAEGGASGGTDDGSGTGGDGASGQEGGDDTAGDGTAAGGGAGDTGEAEGAGDGTGEGEGTGDGTGTGDGSGDGTGDGSGSGDGSGEGLGGAGGRGTGGGLFSDYVDPYNAPALLKRALPLEGYSPIDVANEIKNLRSFSFLQPEQVKESLSLFGNPLLEESVMKKLYKTGN